MLLRRSVLGLLAAMTALLGWMLVVKQIVDQLERPYQLAAEPPRRRPFSPAAPAAPGRAAVARRGSEALSSIDGLRSLALEKALADERFPVPGLEHSTEQPSGRA